MSHQFYTVIHASMQIDCHHFISSPHSCTRSNLAVVLLSTTGEKAALQKMLKILIFHLSLVRVDLTYFDASLVQNK